jgi:hypothetical protein
VCARATSPGRPWWRGGDVVLSIFRCGAWEVVHGFAVILVVRCGATSPLFRLPCWCVQAGEVGFNLPSSEDFLKELSSGGLSVARFRHPAGLNGCRAAAPPLLRLCVGMHDDILGASSSIWRWRKTKNLIAFPILFQGPLRKIIGLCCNFIFFRGPSSNCAPVTINKNSLC